MNKSRLSAVLAVSALVVAGCGIPTDNSPRVFESTQASSPEVRPSDPDALPTSGQRIFFVAGVGAAGAGRLLPVLRDVHATALDVLTALFNGPTDLELSTKRAQTAIPTDTKLLGEQAEPDGTIDVNLDNALTGTAGERQILAVAQIVYSLTALEGVKQVRILVNGVSREWPTEDGTPRSEPLTRFAYARFDPSTQPDLPAIPSPTEALVSNSSSTQAPTATAGLATAGVQNQQGTAPQARAAATTPTTTTTVEQSTTESSTATSAAPTAPGG